MPDNDGGGWKGPPMISGMAEMLPPSPRKVFNTAREKIVRHMEADSKMSPGLVYDYLDAVIGMTQLPTIISIEGEGRHALSRPGMLHLLSESKWCPPLLKNILPSQINYEETFVAGDKSQLDLMRMRLQASRQSEPLMLDNKLKEILGIHIAYLDQDNLLFVQTSIADILTEQLHGAIEIPKGAHEALIPYVIGVDTDRRFAEAGLSEYLKQGLDLFKPPESN